MIPVMLIFDGHLDIAMNALGYERDQRLPVGELRRREAKMAGGSHETATVSLAAMHRGGAAACVATVIARTKPVSPERRPGRGDLDYPTQDMAHAAARAHLAYYEALERQGVVTIIKTSGQLTDLWARWEKGDASAPIGVIVTMEGADPLVEPAEVRHWWDLGLRSLMMAHMTLSAYAYGTPPPEAKPSDQGPLTAKGRQLLKEMTGLAMPLDLTHLCDTSFFEAVDAFAGPVYASHSNCRVVTPGFRQLSDEQVKLIVERDGVIGSVLCNSMLRPGTKATLGHDQVSLADVAIHIDHVCQLAGDARHAAIGSDLDGGFGVEWSPREIDTIADLPRIGDELVKRGYGDADIAAVLHGNWLRFWKRVLPA
jgi:membrane dipeptidase